MQAADRDIQFLKMLKHVGGYDSIRLFDAGIVQIIDICIDQSYVFQLVSFDNLFGFISLDVDALHQIEGIRQGRKKNPASTAEVDSDAALYNSSHHAAMNRLEAGPKKLADKANRIKIQSRHPNTVLRDGSKNLRRDLLKLRR